MVRPVTVEPETGDLAKPGAKFAYLSMQEPQVVFPCRTTLLPETIGRMMPVEQGIIEAQFHVAAPGTGIRQFAQRIAFERRAGHLVIAQRGIVHAEAIVVAAGDDHIPLSCISCNAGPFVSVELHRV